MNDHDPKNTRITIERITVTSIRLRRGAKVYCDLCRCEIETGAGPVIEQPKTKLLTTGKGHSLKEEI